MIFCLWFNDNLFVLLNSDSCSSAV